MSVRSATLYVEPRTIKRLRLALTLYPKYRTNAETGIQTVITADELADTLLNETLEFDFPLVTDLEKALKQTEKEFIAKVAKQ